MQGRTITVLDPTSQPKIAIRSLNPRPKDIRGLRIATVDNTKPNFSIFLDRIEEILVRDHGVAEVKRYRKPGRTSPVSPEILAEIKSSYDFAITGLGD